LASSKIRYGVIELYPSGIAFTMTKSSLQGRVCQVV
jgi:hypothetical protein